MNYEEKYKEMKKRVLAIGQGYVKEVDYNSPRSIAEYIDPDLKESEDERIRKGIICGMNALKEQHKETFASIPINDCIAWLEKQCDKVDVLDDFPTEFERQISHLIASSINKEWEYKKDFVKHTANALLQYAKNELEKQGEQKPTPKFKIGDTIHKIGENTVFPMTIEKIEDGDYVCNNSHSFVNIKFQDDYELVEQKTAWSEEDEEMYNEVLIDIIYTKNDLKTKGCLELSKKAMKAFNWFSKRHKSLRPQSKWKPSEKQMIALKNAIVGKRGPLYELYFDLEKL